MVKLLALVRPYMLRLLAIVISSMVISSMTAAMAWLVKYYVDDVLINTDPSQMKIIPLLIVAFFGTRGVFVFIQRYLSSSTGAKIIRELRHDLYSHLVDMPLGFFHRNPSGSLISRILNDTNLIQINLIDSSKGLFVEGFSVVALLGVAFWRRWDLTLITIIVLPAAFWTVNRIAKRIKAVAHRGQRRISNLTDVLTETFGAMKIVKGFILEDNLRNAFSEENRSYYRLELKNARLLELAGFIMEISSGIGIGIILWYGGRLAMGGQMTPGDFTSYITAIMLVFSPMKRLASVDAKLHQALAAFERVSELMDRPPEDRGGEELPAIRKELIFENVELQYKRADYKALDGINLKISAGEAVALVGRSGAGKTSLVDLIPRFFRPTSGRILIDGRDTGRATIESLRGQIGIVSQEVILFDDTISNNIAMGRPGAPFDEIEKAAKAAFADDFIRELPDGYDTRIGERGVMLSGGQRQRISIARAVLKDPAILILDEATSALDTASEIAVQKALERLMKNRTSLVIAHRLSTVRNADRIVVMEKGKIIETGAHDELLEKGGIYAELNRLQLR